MPEFNTSLYDLQKPDRVNPSRLARQNIASGTVEFAVIPYTLAGTEAANDTINLMVLPEDCIPIPALSSVVCGADPGTTLTMDIGTTADPDGWADGIVLSSGGQVACTNTAIPAWVTQTPITPDAGSGNAVVRATVASASSLTAAVVLTFILAFKRGR
jgi:hypothetical protein